jgi:hypothetical protein
MHDYLPHPSRLNLRGFGWSIALVLTCAVAQSRAQTVVPADPGANAKEAPVLRQPSGVQVHIEPVKPNVSDQELIEALDAEVRLLRDRQNKQQTAHEEPVPPAPKPFLPQTTTVPPNTETPASVLTCQEAPVEASTWFAGHTLTGLPPTLLWQPPMASPYAPRMGVMMTSLSNSTTTRTIDTAIGGEFGLVRWAASDGVGLQFQQDVFAVVFSRFSNEEAFTAADFRFGLPLTFAYDNWHWHIGYEHTSTHAGDDFIQNTGILRYRLIRDELAAGVDYVFWNQLRIYGEYGYAFYLQNPAGGPPGRFGWGLEWSKRETTDWYGQPFAAFDMAVRGDENYTLNVTTQVGWQWRDSASNRSLRVGLEYYTGRSPFGQFNQVRESYTGVGMWFDF